MKKQVPVCRIVSVLAFLLGTIFLSGETAAMDAARLPHPMRTLLPRPSSVQTGEGTFTLNSGTVIRNEYSQVWPDDLSQELQAFLQEAAGLSLAVETSGEPKGSSIALVADSADSADNPDAYELVIEPETIRIRAGQPSGIFYGIQTLRQLIDTVRHQDSGSSALSLPCGRITDRPAHRWRGLLLDCARHFMSPEFIKRTIDLLAYHKMNVLHLHLTDDQGWRVESRAFPKLNEVGSYRGTGEKRYGGYYTREQLRDILGYAAARYVQVVPEFEMPGHASAAVASYPHLSCHGRPIDVVTEWGIFEDVFCPGKETTFEFLQGVLDEWLEIFPSAYIHIGGDEAPRRYWKECPDCLRRMQEEGFKTEDELQGYLIRRIGKFLAERNRRLIGWDEILDVGDLPPTAVVQTWRSLEGVEGVTEAVREGHDVIASPNSHVYFDYPNDDVQQREKPDWMSVTTLEKVYSFEPVPAGLSAEEAARIKGSECALWTEHAPQDRVDIQLFPRMPAFSEVLWTPTEQRDFADFQQRLETHLPRLERWGVEVWGEHSSKMKN